MWCWLFKGQTGGWLGLDLQSCLTPGPLSPGLLLWLLKGLLHSPAWKVSPSCTHRQEGEVSQAEAETEACSQIWSRPGENSRRRCFPVVEYYCTWPPEHDVWTRCEDTEHKMGTRPGQQGPEQPFFPLLRANSLLLLFFP